MTKKELITALIKHYKNVIDQIKVARKEDMPFILELTNTSLGICYCCRAQFEKDIYGDAWVIKYNKTAVSWGRYPGFFSTRKEILAALQIRLNNLNKELKTCK